MNKDLPTIGDITKEIYGPKIVEQLTQETILGKMLGSQSYIPQPLERPCVTDDLEIWASDYDGMTLACNNCRNEKDLGHTLDVKDLFITVAGFDHREYTK